jgi:hypothetical protein
LYCFSHATRVYKENEKKRTSEEERPRTYSLELLFDLWQILRDSLSKLLLLEETSGLVTLLAQQTVGISGCRVELETFLAERLALANERDDGAVLLQLVVHLVDFDLMRLEDLLCVLVLKEEKRTVSRSFCSPSVSSYWR